MKKLLAIILPFTLAACGGEAPEKHKGTSSIETTAHMASSETAVAILEPGSTKVTPLAIKNLESSMLSLDRRLKKLRDLYLHLQGPACEIVDIGYYEVCLAATDAGQYELTSSKGIRVKVGADWRLEQATTYYGEIGCQGYPYYKSEELTAAAKQDGYVDLVNKHRPKITMLDGGFPQEYALMYVDNISYEAFYAGSKYTPGIGCDPVGKLIIATEIKHNNPDITGYSDYPMKPTDQEFIRISIPDYFGDVK